VRSGNRPDCRLQNELRMVTRISRIDTDSTEKDKFA